MCSDFEEKIYIIYKVQNSQKEPSLTNQKSRVKVSQKFMSPSKSSGHTFYKILGKSNENSGRYRAKRDVGTTYPEVKGQRSEVNPKWIGTSSHVTQ